MLFLIYLLIIIAGLLVIFSKNTVQSVLYLILVFLLCSLLFIYLGADFIGLIILIVYIGAIAVLFLFVVMMLNIRLLEDSFNIYIYIPIIIFISLIIIFQVIYFFFNIFNIIEIDNLVYYVNWNFSNNVQISSIGELLFNKLYILFIGAAILLFIAMIGAIILTMDDDLNLLEGKKYNIEKLRFYSININWKYIK
jgi:NADH-quinone oxidoreductase subunit J